MLININEISCDATLSDIKLLRTLELVDILGLSPGAIIIKTNLYPLTWSCITKISPSSGDPLSSSQAAGPKYVQMMDYRAQHPYKDQKLVLSYGQISLNCRLKQ